MVASEVITGEQEGRRQFRVASWCLAVFDGMGGHHGGEIASREAASCLSNWHDWGMAGVAEGVRSCNRQHYEMAKANPEWHAMGATGAGLVCGPDGLLAFNVGDPRVYRFNGGFLQPLTKDDSLHQVLLDTGQVAGERSAVQHTILQSLGGRSDFTEIEPHVNPVRLRTASRFLICSDGITDMLDADSLEAAVQDRATSEDCARSLYEAALQVGGKDNLSVIVMDIKPTASE